MEEHKPETEDSKSKTTANKPIHRHWAVWLLAVLVLSLCASGGYLWIQLQSAKDAKQKLQQEKQELKQQVDKLQKAAKDASPAEADAVAVCTYQPNATFKDNIKAALDSKNTAAFSTYTTDPVRYVLAASEYGGNVTPAEAATSLEYTHSATAPWDFNLPAATIAGYDAGFYTDYFGANTLVGKAASGMVVSFDFNCDGSKISSIFVAADEDLL